jgi:ATP-dependent DNA ligase
MTEPLSKRRELLETHVLPKLIEPIRYSPQLTAALPDLIRSVKVQGLEGLIAKRRDSVYEPGLRSGAWRKMRINQGQEFVVAGYTPSPKNFDALVIGYYDSARLIYVARTRNGFTPASRGELFKKIEPLKTETCPFANLPEKKSGRWGAGLTAGKMAERCWLKPVLVGNLNLSNGQATITCDIVASFRCGMTNRREKFSETAKGRKQLLRFLLWANKRSHRRNL